MPVRFLPLMLVVSPQFTSAATVDGPATIAALKASGAKLTAHAAQKAPDKKGCGMPTKKGKVITVLKDWGKDSKEGELLATFRRRMLKETGITHVISPDYNAAHRDHLHIDRGLPWGWWFKS